jgi:hypothetical protein
MNALLNEERPGLWRVVVIVIVAKVRRSAAAPSAAKILCFSTKEQCSGFVAFSNSKAELLLNCPVMEGMSLACTVGQYVLYQGFAGYFILLLFIKATFTQH